MWYRLHELDSVPSTSDVAFASISAGEAGHGEVFVAREQTAGRGRLGRRWCSARDEGLYMSVVLGPLERMPRPTALTMAVALAVREGLAGLGTRGVDLRWPNDLVAGGAKLAGILVESRGLDPARPVYVVGVGVNVRQREFPAELVAERPVTSLARLGVETQPAAVARAVLETLPGRLESDPDLLATDFLAATRLAGARVRVSWGREERVGRVRALHPGEGLLLELDSGERARLPLEHVAALERLGE